MSQPTAPQWGPPPPPQPKRKHTLRNVLIGLTAIAVLIVVGVSCAVMGAVSSTDPGSGSGTVTTDSGSQQKEEKRDLVSFKLDDRSIPDLEDIWVTWEIKNHSSKVSDYSWDWEAVDNQTGKRVENSTEFEEQVAPGQTVTGEMFTTLKDADVTINVTNFDRTASY